MPRPAGARSHPATNRGIGGGPAGDVVIWTSWGHFIIIDIEVLRRVLADGSRQTKIEWDERIDRERVVALFRRAILQSTVPPNSEGERESSWLQELDTGNSAYARQLRVAYAYVMRMRMRRDSR